MIVVVEVEVEGWRADLSWSDSLLDDGPCERRVWVGVVQEGREFRPVGSGEGSRGVEADGSEVEGSVG